MLINEHTEAVTVLAHLLNQPRAVIEFQGMTFTLETQLVAVNGGKVSTPLTFPVAVNS